MSNRKRNMLEAFQASAQEAQGEHTPHSTGGAGGPFAEEARETKGEARPERERVVVREREFDTAAGEVPTLAQAIARLPLGPIAGGSLLVLVLVFWLGFLAGGASTVEAASPNNNDSELAERGNAASERGTASASGPEGATPYDNKFFSLWRNGYTLRVASYDSSERSRDLAWETYYYLYDEKFPVVTPVGTENSIFIFVGAANSIANLADLEDRVRVLDGPSGNKPFGEAYPVNISDYVQR